MPTNFALASNGATITPYAEPYAPHYASYLIDGYRHTRNAYSSGNSFVGDTPGNLIIEFDGSKTINTINIFGLADAINYNTDPTLSDVATTYCNVHLSASIWDDEEEDWVEVGSITGNDKVWVQFLFDDVATTKIKVDVISAINPYFILTEIEALGESTTPVIDQTTVANGNVDDVYSEDLTVSGGVTPIVWTKESGTLPPGITFNTSTHTFEGTPTKAGVYPDIVIRATGNDAAFDENTFSIEILPATHDADGKYHLRIDAGNTKHHGKWRGVIDGFDGPVVFFYNALGVDPDSDSYFNPVHQALLERAVYLPTGYTIPDGELIPSHNYKVRLHIFKVTDFAINFTLSANSVDKSVTDELGNTTSTVNYSGTDNSNIGTYKIYEAIVSANGSGGLVLGFTPVSGTHAGAVIICALEIIDVDKIVADDHPKPIGIIICQGDSRTDGVGTTNYPSQDQSWPAELKQIDDIFFNYLVLNKGASGDQTYYFESEVATDVTPNLDSDKYQHQVYAQWGGTNDFNLGGASGADVYGHLKDARDAATTAGVTLALTCKEVHRGDGAGTTVNPKVDTLNGLLEADSSFDGQLVPLDTLTLETTDGVHETENSTPDIAALVFEFIPIPPVAGFSFTGLNDDGNLNASALLTIVDESTGSDLVISYTISNSTYTDEEFDVAGVDIMLKDGDNPITQHISNDGGTDSVTHTVTVVEEIVRVDPPTLHLTITGLPVGFKLYMEVKAVDVEGNVSAYSNQGTDTTA